MTDGTIPGPEHVAAKLALVAERRNPTLSEQFEKLPRLAEALWFIEWQRRQRGGLPGLWRDLVAHAGESILPGEFLSLPVDRKGQFSTDDVFAVWNRLPDWVRPRPPEELYDAVQFAEAAAVIDARGAKEAGIPIQTVEAIRQWLTRARCLDQCAENCPSRLQTLIADFFSGESSFPQSLTYRTPWAMQRSRNPFRIMSNLPALLLGYMDAHAGREQSKVAETEVTKLVFEALEYAFDTRSMVLILGESRYGKTESMMAWTNACPGKARLVRTPSMGGEKMLQIRIAEALGFECDCGTPLSTLREKVCFVLRHGAPMLVFDESNFLLPASYSRNTAPSRLNFVRTEIVDAGMACVLSATPQAHKSSMEKFVKKTKFAMEQWLGRIDLVYPLPVELSPADMLNVTQFQLPGISQRSAKLIVSRGMQSDQFLHAVKSIGKRAEWLARRRVKEASVPGAEVKSVEPTTEEINQASDEFIAGVCSEIEDLLPEQSKVAIGASRPEPRTPAESEDAPRRGADPTFGARSIKPSGHCAELTPIIREN